MERERSDSRSLAPNGAAPADPRGQRSQSWQTVRVVCGVTPLGDTT
jgi:hypothetical protein